MKDKQKTMSKTQALNDLIMLLNLYDKQNKYDDIDYPFLYNFATFGKWFVSIKRNKKGLYEVFGRVPWYVEFSDHYSNKFYDVFSVYETLPKAKDDFYIIVEKLAHKEYVK